jgi:hypothetical protein
MTIIRALILLGAVLALAACGGGGEEATTSPTSAPAADETPQVALPAYLCQDVTEPSPTWNVQVTAKWEGKDRIVIEGSADLPGPGTVNYWACQDGEPTAALRWIGNPEFKNGKIKAELKLEEGRPGPPFDPDARFEVFVSILGDPVQVPYFTIPVLVEGKPG